MGSFDKRYIRSKEGLKPAYGISLSSHQSYGDALISTFSTNEMDIF